MSPKQNGSFYIAEAHDARYDGSAQKNKSARADVDEVGGADCKLILYMLA